MVSCRMYLTVYCSLSVVANSIGVSFRLHRREREQLISRHNFIRRQFAVGTTNRSISNMNALTWSRSLARDAGWLIDTEQTGRGQDSIALSYFLHLNVASLSDRNVTLAVEVWNSERVYLLPDDDVCLFLRNCIHFLTMMNAEHQHVGCRFKPISNGSHGNAGYQLVCLYSGGKSGLPVYKRGTPCTRCSSGVDFCDRGLCVPCTRREPSNCDCRKTCNRPMVGAGTLDRSTCSCKCLYGNGPNCDEPCVNQEMYENWDICADIPDEMCSSSEQEDLDMLAEFCPTKCHCRPYPGS